MSFMEPQYTNEKFVGLTNEQGNEDCHVPFDVASDLEREGWKVFETIEGKWWCRLSASGYMDCTDWSGPFDTENEAREYLSEIYDVDPDTGGDLPEA